MKQPALKRWQTSCCHLSHFEGDDARQLCQQRWRMCLFSILEISWKLEIVLQRWSHWGKFEESALTFVHIDSHTHIHTKLEDGVVVCEKSSVTYWSGRVQIIVVIWSGNWVSSQLTPSVCSFTVDFVDWVLSSLSFLGNFAVHGSLIVKCENSQVGRIQCWWYESGSQFTGRWNECVWTFCLFYFRETDCWNLFQTFSLGISDPYIMG